jgi:surface antigen
MNPMLRILILALLTAAASPALAQSWRGTLRNTPAERFQDEDWAVFLKQVYKTLDEAPDNQTTTWERAETKRGGELTVLRSYEAKGRRCRELRVQNHGDGRKADNTFHLCSVDGKWRLVGAPQPQKKP